MARKDARAWAMRLMYARELGGEDLPLTLEQWIEEEKPKNWRPEDAVYALELLEGTGNCVQELDARLAAHAKHWRLDRMSRVDLAILRLATYELLYRTADVPAEAAVNEAVELAKAYGGSDSRSFINGILASLLREMQGAQ